MDTGTHNNGAPPPQNTLSFAHSADAVAKPRWLLPSEQAPQPPCNKGQCLLLYGCPVPCPWRLQMEDEHLHVATTKVPAMTFAQLMELATTTPKLVATTNPQLKAFTTTSAETYATVMALATSIASRVERDRARTSQCPMDPMVAWETKDGDE